MSCEEKKTTMTASLRRRGGEGVVGSFDIPCGKFLRDKSLVPSGKRRVVGRPGFIVCHYLSEMSWGTAKD